MLRQLIVIIACLGWGSWFVAQGENTLLPLEQQYEDDGHERSDIWQPTPNTTWQWQLTDEINTEYDVAMYDIDLFETPIAVIESLHADGRIVICYFSAGSYEEWRPDAEQFPPDLIGQPLADWAGEFYLDIRAIEQLASIMTARLDLAVKKGCDGVEPDNIDAYEIDVYDPDADSGFDLQASDQLAYNIWLAEAAHERGLSIGLKNDGSQAAELLDYFDWALVESCFRYDFCDDFLPFIEADKAVFAVEYDDSPLSRSEYCPQALAMAYSVLSKDIDLGDTPPQACSIDDA